MKQTSIELKNWQLITLPNALVKEQNITAMSAEELLSAGHKAIRATVPGNFELDLMREGLIPDLYFGTNILEAQKLENLHLITSPNFSMMGTVIRTTFLSLRALILPQKSI